MTTVAKPEALVNTRHVYEIINPSDPYTIEGELGPCSIALLLVGPSGGYALNALDGTEGFPILMFGGDPELQAACEKVGIWPLDEYLNEHRAEIIEALHSIVIGNRELFLETMALMETEKTKAAFRETWHDKNRSSLNDIGGRAQEIADRLTRSQEAPDA